MVNSGPISLKTTFVIDFIFFCGDCFKKEPVKDELKLWCQILNSIYDGNSRVNGFYRYFCTFENKNSIYFIVEQVICNF